MHIPLHILYTVHTNTHITHLNTFINTFAGRLKQTDRKSRTQKNLSTHLTVCVFGCVYVYLWGTRIGTESLWKKPSLNGLLTSVSQY